MRPGRTTAALLLAGSVVALAAPTALAVGDAASLPSAVPAAAVAAASSASFSAASALPSFTSLSFSVSPETVAPGGRVTVRAAGCPSAVTVSAPALFHDVTLRGGEGRGRSATVRVGDSAKPGARYDVAFQCGAEKGTTPLMIGDGTSRAPSAPAGPARTGLGGGIGAPNTVAIIAGGALAGAAGLYVIGRRTRRRTRRL
ncbi:hypothetical protein GA0115240_16113 [Streptomyces sp. DvalAA-14]|uniref:hypothetical protein n=1 Tax=unclassified Streptomyces TaxID=2593676 RepID=UPI00081B7169|nr:MULTISPECIES: hypothetical protein [unclassified Streptomyces]MYS24172.1 hypothetical protein [Streptomyces sp. SID4948]SCE43364.1 hypothetical protein GA0115240_16113 [Streptomyces sp. DvalAA-14]